MFRNLKQQLRKVAIGFINPNQKVRNDLLVGKFLVIGAGGLLALFNWLIDPSSLVTIPQEACPPDLWLHDKEICQINESNIRAAGYTLITATALLAGILPGTQVHWDAPNARMVWDWAGEVLGRLLGVAAAFGAGWYWLGAETFGNRGDYVKPMLGFVALAAVVVMTGGWSVWFLKAVIWPTVTWIARKILFNLFVLTLVWSVLILVATVWCLLTVARNVWLSTRAGVRRIRYFFP